MEAGLELCWTTLVQPYLGFPTKALGGSDQVMFKAQSGPPSVATHSPLTHSWPPEVWGEWG